jgi:hypothetical protein
MPAGESRAVARAGEVVPRDEGILGHELPWRIAATPAAQAAAPQEDGLDAVRSAA